MNKFKTQDKKRYYSKYICPSKINFTETITSIYCTLNLEIKLVFSLK